VLAFGPAYSAVASQQLSAREPIVPPGHPLEHLHGWLIGYLNTGEVWQAPDLLGQRAVCPLDDHLETGCIGGFSHRVLAVGVIVCPLFGSTVAKSLLRSKCPTRRSETERRKLALTPTYNNQAKVGLHLSERQVYAVDTGCF